MTAGNDALRARGIERLVLGVHDGCFPGTDDDDVGRGTPYGEGAHDLLRFAAELGFTGIQLGPQGEITDTNPSPYDGAAFSRSTLSIALSPLVEAGLLSGETRDHLVVPRAAASNRSDHLRAARAMREALDEVARNAEPLRARVHAFATTHAEWLLRDAFWEALAAEHGGRDFEDWPDLDRNVFCDGARYDARRAELEAKHRAVFERFQIVQTLAHEQHEAFRARARALGLTVYGDLQVGWSRRDLYFHRDVFLPGYRMGAPPSRTNPEGQPWGYPVLDPGQFTSEGGRRGPALALVAARFAKVLAEYDGVRIDHPHGWVCPWVYAIDDARGDAFHAVQNGARLFDSPDLPDHPALARYAIARPDQIDRQKRRFDDGWVHSLEPVQVARYAAIVDLLIVAMRVQQRAVSDVIPEVLSTMPYPLGRVLARHGLGRFRVTQKASLVDPHDVYRPENARPEDWVMVGTHDTLPIWALAEPAVARAKLAQLFAGPAKNVYVWWGDLFGETEAYNVPGTVSDRNWSLRLPRDFRAVYASRVAEGRAFDVRGILEGS